ncbi:hypothetical protein ACR79N_16030 [Sphingobacterium siyangense]|uniref:hypothetical protein n=1 Tax=Sphingobacterium siyangense TaxID=459529 RepID=UPI003DA4C8EC
MERTLENVHVVIYSKKMLKEAIKRLNNLGQVMEIDIINSFDIHGCDLLVFHDSFFKMLELLPSHPNHEVTLNELCEMIISLEDHQYKLGDIVFSELKHNPGAGFTIQNLMRKDMVDFHNSRICKDLYNTRKIDNETAERLRKEFLCGKQ